jgi:two-component system, NtrC family, response regulator HupR/HoxA
LEQGKKVMSEARPTLLIVDDEVRSLEALNRILCDDFNVRVAANVAEANVVLEREWVQLILCDQRMPDMSGVDYLTLVRERWPEVIRIIISGYTDTEDVIRGINQAGIFQYITKPWQPDSLLLTLKNAAQLFDLNRQNEVLAAELKMSVSHVESKLGARKQAVKQRFNIDDGIIRAEGSPMNEVCSRLRQIAPFDVSVVLQGESGTGKELAARALHYNSLRWNKPFVAENCGAVPDELLESELFGHKRGAFTGAVADHIGLFERANGGTVFLDEVGEISPAFQVKLLRVLQNGEVRAVGASKPIKVDVRVVAASNRNLENEVQAGRFREDLYYRLAGITVTLPPLRDRKMDIAVVAAAYLENAAKSFGKATGGLAPETLEIMRRYAWPGNIRELQNELQGLLIMTPEGAPITPDMLSPRIAKGLTVLPTQEVDTLLPSSGTLKNQVEQIEGRVLRETLIRLRWNKSKAAKELGLSRVGLRLKLQRYGLENVEQLNVALPRRAVGNEA